MAMRPRTPKTQTPVRPVYETFQPNSEMKENDEAYFLHIYLPGFIKERIKINFVAASRTLRVVGERPIVGSNKWSRFDQSYPVPENCEVEKLLGKFENGTLIVTMPKKFTPPKPQVATIKEKGGAISPRTPKGVIPSISTTTTRVEEPSQDKKTHLSPGNVQGLNDMKKLKDTQNDTTHGPIDDKGLRPKNVEEESSVLKTKAIGATPREQKGNKPQKGQEEIEPKNKLTMDSKNQIDDENLQDRQKALIEKVKRELQEKADEKESVTKKEVEEVEEDKKPYESRKVDQKKYVDHNMFLKGKEIKARKESPKGEESSAPKAAKKEKETGRRTATIDKATKSNNKKDEIYTKGKGIKEVAASASQVVKRIGEGKLSDQEKPLVANMGAAILVIVALGAYVTYKFTSSSRT